MYLTRVRILVVKIIIKGTELFPFIIAINLINKTYAIHGS